MDLIGFFLGGEVGVLIGGGGKLWVRLRLIGVEVLEEKELYVYWDVWECGILIGKGCNI